MSRRPRPLVAAALIVRDEADQVMQCLAGVGELVDEMVVYDTGSVDGTAELARQAGARVLVGPWDGDFARARNLALEMTRAWWVLSVDADERVLADGDAVRQVLRGEGGERGQSGERGESGERGGGRAMPEAFSVLTEHVSADGRALAAQNVIRLFRPDRARWRGRVHEHVELPAQSRPVRFPPDLLRIRHLGYADDAKIRAKAERNLVLAQAELDDLVARRSTDREAAARVLFDLARCQLAVGRRQDAVDALETLREIIPTGVRRALATALLAQILLDDGGFAEVALVLEAELRADGTTEPGMADWIRAQALAGLGRPAEALDLLRGIDRLVDAAGVVRPVAAVLRARTRLARALGRRGEARAALLTVVLDHGPGEGDLESLLELFEGDPGELTRALHARGGPFLAAADAAVRRVVAGGS